MVGKTNQKETVKASLLSVKKAKDEFKRLNPLGVAIVGTREDYEVRCEEVKFFTTQLADKLERGVIFSL